MVIDRIARVLAWSPPVRIAQDERRRAAVLIPLIGRGELDVIFVQRPDDAPTHPGQIAFPGGGARRGESAIETALRETEEEIGVAGGHVEVLGELDDLVTSSRFVVTPVVGVIRGAPELHRCEREVKAILRIPFELFLSERTFETRDVGERRGVPFYTAGEHMVWGATARMMKRLVDLLRSDVR